MGGGKRLSHEEEVKLGISGKDTEIIIQDNNIEKIKIVLPDRLIKKVTSIKKGKK